MTSSQSQSAKQDHDQHHRHHHGAGTDEDEQKALLNAITGSSDRGSRVTLMGLAANVSLFWCFPEKVILVLEASKLTDWSVLGS
jgi:hypothetical protein